MRCQLRLGPAAASLPGCLGRRQWRRLPLPRPPTPGRRLIPSLPASFPPSPPLLPPRRGDASMALYLALLYPALALLLPQVGC